MRRMRALKLGVMLQRTGSDFICCDFEALKVTGLQVICKSLTEVHQIALSSFILLTGDRDFVARVYDDHVSP